MKKIRISLLGSRCFSLTKLLIFMKLTTFFLLINFVSIAATGYSQTEKVTIQLKNASMKDFFSKVENQTSYKFLYRDDAVENIQVNLDESEVPLDIILNQILESSKFGYKILDNNLIAIAPVEVFQPSKVSGTVSDEKGNPLPGVTILVKGTTLGVLTDANGKYTLNDATQDATLSFSFIGYITKEVVVGSQRDINITLEVDVLRLEEVVVIGYGTAKKSDLTGSVVSVRAEDFKTKPMVQMTEMLSGTIAGFNSNQGTSAAGGASLEIRGPKSLSAATDPLIVLDGVIFNGSLRDINPNDIQSVDILKDASSAAVYGAKAASGVVLITTIRGKSGKPIINFSTKLGMSEVINQRRPLGTDAYIQYRQDYFRQVFPNIDFNFYTNPNKLPSSMTTDQWRALSLAPLADNTDEWLSRLRFFPIEQENFKAGKTMDMFDQVFRKGIQQDYDLSISGGTDNTSYYWSLGSNKNEGIIVGDQYSSIRSRLNAEYKIVNWLNVGLNAQYSDRDESSVPASLGTLLYDKSPYGEMFDDNGNLKRYPHDYPSDNPLLNYYRTNLLNKTNSLFTSMYANIKLPFGVNFKVSYQPNYQTTKYLSFTTISDKLGGVPNEIPSGERRESSAFNWMVDNLLTWKKEIGIHSFDLTLLANVEENRYWSSDMTNKNFLPNQNLSYHGMQFGNTPGISTNDTRNSGDALMARLNYTLMGRYYLTASVRRDGYSAFGLQNPRATFPAFALAWAISDESFFKVDFINRLKLRLSWGANGNRDIGMYSALATTGSSLWYDGTSTRVGVSNSTLANAGLKWERTESLNIGLDIAILKNRIDLTTDYYDMTTTDLLMNRILPKVTGFDNIMANLGELGNRGFEMTFNTINISKSDFTWKSSLVFSLNRNKIKKLFGDIGTYTLLGKAQTGDVPDFTNQWFPGQPIDIVWNYNVTGIWQTNEAEAAKVYNLEPGDYKVLDVDSDGKLINLNDKQFIGHDVPQYRLGLRNDFTFLKNFTASIFIRADLGFMREYDDALNSGWESDDRQNRLGGYVPYWTVDNPNNEYPRLNPNISSYGGGLLIYKQSSFVRVQDISLTYNMPSAVTQQLKLNHLQIFGSIRNLATFTKWPGWDPESGMTPMPRTYTFGINLSL
jgi:TonB-dependent starch-binding outer membrane protein SusC